MANVVRTVTCLRNAINVKHFYAKNSVCVHYLLAVYECKLITKRHLCSKKDKSAVDDQVIERRHDHQNQQLTVAQKVTQASKNAGYSLVVIGGLAVFAVIIYTLGKELFSKTSPQYVYSEAVKLVKKDPRVCYLLGEPLLAYGAESHRRVRRQYADYGFITENNVTYMVMVFFVSGPNGKANGYIRAKLDNKQNKYKIIFLKLVPEWDSSKFLIIVNEDE